MGFLGLAPAKDLGALYDPVKQVLKLFARGEAQNFTYGYEFQRLTWLGGLKFELLAWSGPFGPGSRKYEHSQSFDIPNINSIDPEGSVIIVTASHSKGKTVPVYWLGFGQDDTTIDPFAGPSPETNDIIPPYAPPHLSEVVKINALYKESFIIQEPTPATKAGSVKMQFSPFALTLQNASIESDNLVWEFNSLETGRTQVIVTFSAFGGIAFQKAYDINVFVLDNSLMPGDAPQGPPGAILDFVGRLTIAQTIVRRTAPEAELLVAKATLPPGVAQVLYPVKDPLLLTQLECIFKTKSGTAIIQSSNLGVYGPPVFKPYQRVGNEVINIKDIAVDIVPAADAVQAHGIDLPFINVTLDHPLIALGQLSDEPYYIFDMVDGSCVFVGAKDKEVIVNPAGEKMLPSPTKAA